VPRGVSRQQHHGNRCFASTANRSARETSQTKDDGTRTPSTATRADRRGEMGEATLIRAELELTPANEKGEWMSSFFEVASCGIWWRRGGVRDEVGRDGNGNGREAEVREAGTQ